MTFRVHGISCYNISGLSTCTGTGNQVFRSCGQLLSRASCFEPRAIASHCQVFTPYSAPLRGLRLLRRAMHSQASVPRSPKREACCPRLQMQIRIKTAGQEQHPGLGLQSAACCQSERCRQASSPVLPGYQLYDLYVTMCCWKRK